MITSSQNPKIKRIRHLQTQARFRKKESAFVVEGIRLIEEIVTAKLLPELVIYSRDLDQRGSSLLKKLIAQDISCEEVSENVLKYASDTESPQGILSVLPWIDLPFPPEIDFVLIADEIRDPGNLGTLLRTARAAGVCAVLLSPGTVDPYSPKVLRSGMGAHFSLPIRSLSWKEIQQFTKDLTIFGTDISQGVQYWDADLQPPLGLIIGGEAHGSGEQASQLTQEWVHIPMLEQTESLNASAAGAILMYEIVRQRYLSQKTKDI